MIRTLIVHEVRLVADLIASMLRAQPDFDVIGLASDGGEALAMLDDACDLVLLNATLPDNGASTLVRTLSRSRPGLRSVIMGLNDTTEAVLGALEAGAVGYVLKQDSMDDLVARARAAHGGETYLSPRIATALVERLAALTERCNGAQSATGQFADLTPREREVLGLLGQGLSNQQIAERLVIELGTVKNHVHNILKKLDASNRYRAAELVSRAQQEV
jgi:DNA-binding NarL/FixJ family response regulator